MTKQEQPEQVPDSVQKHELFKALLSEPTKYYIQVVNNSSLPEKLKKKEEISFEIKPPVMSTLTRVAMVVNKMNPEVFNNQKHPSELLQYAGDMCKIIAILAHGNSKKEMPDWYVKFLSENLTPDEVLKIFQESTFKLRTDFFLPSFQNARLNPLMLEKMTVKQLSRKKKGSTRTNK